MDYIKFNCNYCFIKDQIKALEKIINQDKMSGWHIVADLSKLLKDWQSHQKQMITAFNAEDSIFAITNRNDKAWFKQMLHYLSLLKWNPELCKGKYRPLAVFLWQTADAKPQNSQAQKIYNQIPIMVEIMTSFGACVWMLDEATKRGDFAYNFAKWLLEHNFDDDQIAKQIQEMRLNTMPTAKIAYGSDNEDIKKLLDLFNS